MKPQVKDRCLDDVVVLEINNNVAGLGDAICAFPVFKAMTQKQKHPFFPIRYIVYTYFLDFYRKFFPQIHWLPHAQHINSRLFLNGNWLGRLAMQRSHTTMRRHTVDYFFNTILDAEPQLEEKNYPMAPLQPLPMKFSQVLTRKFAVVSVGFTLETKKLPQEVLIAVSQYLKSEGILPVFLGKNYQIMPEVSSKIAATEQELHSLGLNLVDQTDLYETLGLIQRSVLVIGMDSALIHMAGLTDRPIVCCYTIADPIHKMPIRNNEVGYNCFPVVPPNDLACRFCLDKLHERPKFDGSFCYFDDYACLPSSKDFLDQIKTALKQ